LRIDIALVPWGAALAAAAVGISNPLPAQGTAPFVVIVNAGNPVTAVARDELSKIFLKKQSNWDNGNPVVPLDLTEEAAVRDAFTKAVHRRSVEAIKSYWQQQIFSGRDVPPTEESSETDVVAAVRANPNAIGYVSAGAAASASGVRTISVTGS
jgi:ABC-type phosphate transport system substrate-binding protein